ncbi:helix-turn-helix transcriptional regulator [Enterococcus sp. BWM-S5]|uniref:Helix-turn-helix transcriptional regulator n=1 Tax=Enterococcus larvae TaxID=2794352 RepID=A0ABS4CPM7_9ENTE|nr:helix-turn-helix transcriptional regulator [Enterococcus larvae]MBP1048484.1 helix-turn-helix transcriptional regulator [Enterococcus larvae]
MEQLGQVFKELRERKGLKVSETADGVVSPQFLRKFERGDSNISLSNYFLLLNRMNLSVEEFIYEWQGETVDNWLRETEHELDTVSHSGNSLMFKRLVNSYEEKYEETKEQRFYHMALVSKNIYNRFFSVSSEVDMAIVADYLREVEDWGQYEFFLATYALMPFETEELFLRAEQTFRRKVAKHAALHHQVTDFLLHVIFHMIKRNQLGYAERLMKMYRDSGPEKKDLYYLAFDAYAEFLDGLLLIKKNDRSGIACCQRIISFFHQTVHYTDYANRLNIIYESMLDESELSER